LLFLLYYSGCSGEAVRRADEIGSYSLSVKWPDKFGKIRGRTARLIPSAATLIEVRITGTGLTEPIVTSVIRPESETTSTITIDNIPAGNKIALIKALDASSNLLAQRKESFIVHNLQTTTSTDVPLGIAIVTSGTSVVFEPTSIVVPSGADLPFQNWSSLDVTITGAGAEMALLGAHTDGAGKWIFSAQERNVTSGFTAAIAGTGATLSVSLDGNKKEWTILAYLDADNDMQGPIYYNFKEMEAVGSDDNINIIAQWDVRSGTGYVPWTGCRRYYVEKDPYGGSSLYSDPPLQDLGNVNMGISDTLRDFLIWGVQNYPAKKYAIIFVDHGTGWRGAGNSGTGGRWVCIDYTSGNYALHVYRLRQAFTEAKAVTGVNFELIAMDACQMGNLEVAYDLRNFGNYYTGSEAEDPTRDGWNYTNVLQHLQDNYTWNGSSFATDIVLCHADTPLIARTYAAIDMSKLSALGTAIDNFAVRALAVMATEGAHLKRDGENSQSYNSSRADYHDIGHFADLVYNDPNITDLDLKLKALAIRNALDDAVIIERHGSWWPHANGLTIWMPTSSEYSSYIAKYLSDLVFPAENHWDEYLQQVITY